MCNLKTVIDKWIILFESNLEIICPKCGVELSLFNEKGQHNFCPTSASKGRIINICMKCKIEEIVAK